MLAWVSERADCVFLYAEIIGVPPCLTGGEIFLCFVLLRIYWRGTQKFSGVPSSVHVNQIHQTLASTSQKQWGLPSLLLQRHSLLCAGLQGHPTFRLLRVSPPSVDVVSGRNLCTDSHLTIVSSMSFPVSSPWTPRRSLTAELIDFLLRGSVCTNLKYTCPRLWLYQKSGLFHFCFLSLQRK